MNELLQIFLKKVSQAFLKYLINIIINIKFLYNKVKKKTFI